MMVDEDLDRLLVVVGCLVTSSLHTPGQDTVGRPLLSLSCSLGDVLCARQTSHRRHGPATSRTHLCTELQDNDDEAEGKITQTLANIKDIYGELIQFSWQVFQTETTVEIHYF